MEPNQPPRGPRAGTLSAIAHEVGVAVSTVSYVLSGKHREARISQKRVDEIMLVARRMNYRPNAAAVAMRSGRFNAIGFAVSDIAGRQSIFPDMLDQILRTSRENDMHLVMGQLTDEQFDPTHALPRILREWTIDGLLINYLQDFRPELIHAIVEHQIPSLWVNVRIEADCVHPDDQGSTRAAVEHLAALGHRHIAYLTFNHSNHYSHPDRLAGYEQGMRAIGREPRVLSSGTYFPRAERHARAVSMLSGPDRPTAIIAYEIDDALPVMTAAFSMGLRLPDDLSLVGIESWAAFAFFGA